MASGPGRIVCDAELHMLTTHMRFRIQHILIVTTIVALMAAAQVIVRKLSLISYFTD
jgi:hypothetical protein